jgi:hypothetical protein
VGKMPTHVELVTSRYSGGSNLNRVELQNRCESKARAGLFIPSTLNGSNLGVSSGEVHNDQLRRNMLDAVDVYMSRVGGTPCGDTTIKLFPGNENKGYQDLGEKFCIVLKGNKGQKQKLKEEFPNEFAYIQKLLQIQKNHINRTIPCHYIFHLVCCYKKECSHSFFLTALLGTKYITLITYKYNKHAVPKQENSERAIIAHARLPPDLTSVNIYKFT